MLRGAGEVVHRLPENPGAMARGRLPTLGGKKSPKTPGGSRKAGSGFRG